MMNAELVLVIVQSILTYGPSAVTAIAEVMQHTEITVEDVRNLFIDNDPEDYF